MVITIYGRMRMWCDDSKDVIIDTIEMEQFLKIGTVSKEGGSEETLQRLRGWKTQPMDIIMVGDFKKCVWKNGVLTEGNNSREVQHWIDLATRSSMKSV